MMPPYVPIVHQPVQAVPLQVRTLPSLVLSASVLWYRGMGVLTARELFCRWCKPNRCNTFRT